MVITDLDNTLWDWFAAWHAGFEALLNGLVRESGVSQEQLEREIRAIHQANGTTEYTGLVDEIPSLLALTEPDRPSQVFRGPIRDLQQARRVSTLLYPGVAETLATLKGQGIRLVAYTDSLAYWTEWRIRRTGLDGVLDALYSAPDHTFPVGRSPEDLRTRPSEYYGLKATTHRTLPHGVVKPNSGVVHRILDDEQIGKEEAVYVGDSLFKDIAMAQAAGVLDVHAQYGVSHDRREYELLRRVSHWTDADVDRERQSRRAVSPSVVLDRGFPQLLEAIGVR